MMTIYHDHGPCWVCGTDTSARCDYPSCDRWICEDHAVIEAQAWDALGVDGVDVRCNEHRDLSPATRELTYGSGLVRREEPAEYPLPPEEALAARVLA